jgi:hypothetical protein
LAKSSVKVVHQHRLGSCHGRLAITRTGVAFAAEDSDSNEAFTLTYAQFLHAVDHDTLIVKTATRTYRFKAEDSKSGVAQLRDLADRMTRARR